ncbi:MAG TPA: alpha-2-macroglobulin family protein, partial [Flavisolibacter sp.]|nr:alpha-2-macroglobulin family protein [Flavisolibacter sp.]
KIAAPLIKKDEVVLGYSTTTAADSTTTAVTTEPKENPSNPAIQIRKNFNETAFFFPNLHTDKDGNIEFSYKAPEALTTWKLQTFAHTKDLAFGLNQKEVVTQKQLMVQPNVPRFLRQGDHMEFAVKIVNMADSEMTGQVQLELIDATTNQSVDGWFMNTFPNQYFTVSAGQSEVVKFPIQVPFQFNKALVWRVTARSGNSSDGEEDALPVLSNKLLVTETLPLPMRGTGNKQFTFEKLLQSGNSETLQNQALTVEYTSNPAWYAVQALPYLMEFPYECAEQTWNRYYANALASKIAGSSPRMKQIFEQWKNADTAAFLSNLQKNQELKSVLLEETPWVLQATSEEQQKKNIALLFDMMRMNNELKSNLEKLQQMQSENGGFVWFKGGPDDRYITQYIVTGIGHLKKLGVSTNTLVPILKGAIPYLDKKIKEDYDNLIKYKADLSKQQISYLQIQYLYMRSFFDISLDAASKKAYDYYRAQSQKYWM